MDGTKIMIYLVMMNLVIVFGVLAIGGTQKSGDDALNKFVDYNINNGNVSLKSNIQSNFPQTTSQGINFNSIITIIDGLGMIFNIVVLIFSLVAVPVLIFGYLPPLLSIFFCIPSIIMLTLVIISFVRGKDL